MCIQCRKCSAGCPVAPYTDLSPAMAVHFARLGHASRLVSSRHIWLCTSCGACAARCPQGVDPSAAVDAARTVSLGSETSGAVPPQRRMSVLMLRSIAKRGRVYELGLAARIGMQTGAGNVSTGLRMLLKGRLDLLPPSKVKPPAEVVKAIGGIVKDRGGGRQ
jgi:heterodisulfide reductase subunit C